MKVLPGGEEHAATRRLLLLLLLLHSYILMFLAALRKMMGVCYHVFCGGGRQDKGAYLWHRAFNREPSLLPRKLTLGISSRYIRSRCAVSASACDCVHVT